MNNKMQLSKDIANKQLHIVRNFDAPVKLVWRAFTEAEILDQWWGPAPWHAETKYMNFAEGGHWHYAMVGPNEEKQWCVDHFSKIDPYKSYDGTDAFCDENEMVNDSMPSMQWHNVFEDKGNETSVKITITFSSEADLNSIIEMEFEKGFATGLNQLEELLKKGAVK